MKTNINQTNTGRGSNLSDECRRRGGMHTHQGQHKSKSTPRGTRNTKR